MADLGVSLYQSYYSYKAYGAASLALQKGAQQGKGSSQSNSIAKNTANDAAFVRDLEKHLDDYRKGKGYLSKETSNEVARQNQSAFQLFSELDPGATSMFSGYVSGLSYEKRARFVHQAYEAAQNLSQL